MHIRAESGATSIYDPKHNDGGGVLDFIISCAQLVPEKRLASSDIMKLSFFSKLSANCSRELQVRDYAQSYFDSSSF
jgi:hypothetical protein